VPSSLTFTPAALGGFGDASTTAVAACSNPNPAASSPRSDNPSTVIGFFFAAMIPLKFGYRGSLIFSVTDTTTGSDAVTCAEPASVTRSACTAPSSTLTECTDVTCGHPNRSANIDGNAPARPSVDSFPANTTSADTERRAAANTRDVANASDPARPSSCT